MEAEGRGGAPCRGEYGAPHRELGTGIERPSWRSRRAQARLRRRRKQEGDVSSNGDAPADADAEEAEPAPLRVEPRKAKRAPTILLHLPIPHGRAKIDYIAVSPGGVTIVETRRDRGKIRRRAKKLFIARRDRSDLIGRLRWDLTQVRAALRNYGLRNVDVCAAISMVTVEGLPEEGTVVVDGVVVAGPERIASFANRAARGNPLDVDAAARALELSFALEKH